VRILAVLLAASALASALVSAELPVVPEERIAALTFDDCRVDTGYVAPVRDPAALDAERAARFAVWLERFATWEPGLDADPQRRVCALLDCAAMHDIARNEFEGEVARTVFDRLRADIPRDDLVRCCARLVEASDGCPVTVKAPELLGIPGSFEPIAVRQRAQLYAKKLLGRLLGALPE